MIEISRAFIAFYFGKQCSAFGVCVCVCVKGIDLSYCHEMHDTKFRV